MVSFFGLVSYRVEVTSSAVTVQVKVPDRRPPSELRMHVRLPAGQTAKSVTVNGQPHLDFDPVEEVVQVVAPSGDLEIRIDY